MRRRDPQRTTHTAGQCCKTLLEHMLCACKQTNQPGVQSLHLAGTGEPVGSASGARQELPDRPRCLIWLKCGDTMGSWLEQKDVASVFTTPLPVMQTVLHQLSAGTPNPPYPWCPHFSGREAFKTQTCTRHNIGQNGKQDSPLLLGKPPSKCKRSLTTTTTPPPPSEMKAWG